MKKYFSTFANWKVISILSVILLTFNFYLFPKTTSHFQETPLDLRFVYTAEKAYEVLSAYSDEERTLYRKVELSLDVIYPVVYSLLLSFMIFKLRRKSSSTTMTSSILPFGAFVFDLAENFSIAAMISFYPERINSIAWLASACTTAKWTFVFISVVVILILLVQKLKGK